MVLIDCSDLNMFCQGTAGGEVLQIGASRDKQTAADTASMTGGISTGAATFAFIQVPSPHYFLKMQVIVFQMERQCL